MTGEAMGERRNSERRRDGAAAREGLRPADVKIGARMHAQARIADAAAGIGPHAACAAEAARPCDLAMRAAGRTEPLEPTFDPCARPRDQLEVLHGVVKDEPRARVAEVVACP